MTLSSKNIRIKYLTDNLNKKKTRNCCGVMSCKINVGPCSLLACGEHRNKTLQCGTLHPASCKTQNMQHPELMSWCNLRDASAALRECSVFRSDVTLHAAYVSSFITFNWLDKLNRVGPQLDAMKLARLLMRPRFNSRDHLAIIALSYEINKTEVTQG